MVLIIILYCSILVLLPYIGLYLSYIYLISGYICPTFMLYFISLTYPFTYRIKVVLYYIGLNQYYIFLIFTLLSLSFISLHYCYFYIFPQNCRFMRIFLFIGVKKTILRIIGKMLKFMRTTADRVRRGSRRAVRLFFLIEVQQYP